MIRFDRSDPRAALILRSVASETCAVLIMDKTRIDKRNSGGRSKLGSSKHPVASWQNIPEDQMIAKSLIAALLGTSLLVGSVMAQSSTAPTSSDKAAAVN